MQIQTPISITVGTLSKNAAKKKTNLLNIKFNEYKYREYISTVFTDKPNCIL